ncbi:MAG: DUF362 domain-containing protein [Chloroflexota bacterium]
MSINRREFLRSILAWGIGLIAARSLFSSLGCSAPVQPSPAAPVTPSPIPPSSTPQPLPTPTPKPSPTPTPSPRTSSTYLAVARGNSPATITETAIKAIGGIERFVKPGNDVIVKPNICVAYHTYEYAATTNPEVVTAIVKMCLDTGARRVRVMDQPFGGSAEQAYQRSGIAEAVRAAGGQMEVMARMKYRNTPIPDGKDIKSWLVYQDAIDADVLINVPIAKTHGLSRLTLGMKNLMGLILDPARFHSNLAQRVADLTSLLRPELTVIDAVRILTANGPTGGNLKDVKLTNTVIASADPVAADAYAATLFNLTGNDIPIIRTAAQMGLGRMDLKSIRIEELSV